MTSPNDARAFAGDGLRVEVFESSRHDVLHDVAAAQALALLASWLTETVRA